MLHLTQAKSFAHHVDLPLVKIPIPVLFLLMDLEKPLLYLSQHNSMIKVNGIGVALFAHVLSRLSLLSESIK